MPDIKIGTRPSGLAMKQADMVSRRIAEAGLDASIIPVNSSGDVDKDTPLYKSQGTGIFSNEINSMVMEKRLDVAVHSAKDIPTELPDGMEVLVILPRGSFYDAFISSSSIEKIRPGSSIGTSSMRRIRELGVLRPDVKAKNIRGNIDTRIRKLQEGNYDGIILAEAGLLRMNAGISYQRLPVKSFMPAPNQGIIALTMRRDSPVFSQIEKLVDLDGQISLEIERSIMKTLRLGCSMPAGILARKTAETWTADIRLHSLSGGEFMDFSARVSGAQEAVELAKQIMDEVPSTFGYWFGGD